MRRGCRGVATARTVSSGSSDRTVPMPVSTAQARARHAWPSARAASPVIQRLVPSGSAVRPSRLAAAFIRTYGRPRVRRATKPGLRARASASIRPASNRTPDAASFAPPCAASGFGSRIATTTRAMPAATIASAHGGVRPVWLQGSSVTYIVAPRTFPPRSRAAAECRHFRVRPARALVPAFADDAAVVNDDAAHARVGCRRVEPPGGKLERPRHVAPVVVAERVRHCEARRFLPGASTSASASWKSETSWNARYTDAKRM